MIQQLGEGDILKMYKKLRNIGNIFHLFLYFSRLVIVLMAYIWKHFACKVVSRVEENIFDILSENVTNIT